MTIYQCFLCVVALQVVFLCVRLVLQEETDPFRNASRNLTSRLPSSQVLSSERYQRLQTITKNMTSFSTGKHDPNQKRNCLAFTAVPHEMKRLLVTVKEMLERYDEKLIQCIHLSIPETSLRYGKGEYPSTTQLRRVFSDPRIILHRLIDCGPMSRYVGPVAYEKHPDTAIVVFDMDSSDIVEDNRDLAPLISASILGDKDAAWCYGGEDFRYNEELGESTPFWHTYPASKANGLKWNRVFFCRGAAGLLVKLKHFRDFWYNQTAYHETCFWDDDRWIGFQFERQKIHMLNLWSDRRRLGSLTLVNAKLESKHKCTKAWLQSNPHAFPLARVKNSSELM